MRRPSFTEVRLDRRQIAAADDLFDPRRLHQPHQLVVEVFLGTGSRIREIDLFAHRDVLPFPCLCQHPEKSFPFSRQ